MGDQDPSRTFLVLGGAGLVGFQVCRAVAAGLRPSRVVLSSLRSEEAEEACAMLRVEFPELRFEPESGNLFVPEDLAETSRNDLREKSALRGRILDHIFGEFDKAYAENTLARLIARVQPGVIVDAVNTATAISYQDVFGTTARVRELLASEEADPGALRHEVEVLLMAQGAPQLTRHIRFLYEACREASVRIYVKVGTTGTGGMGLNIPYTHSEDRPSQKLLGKSEIGFGHTGLLFVMARTPDAPIVKEVKPAAMIGYRAVRYEQVRGPDGSPQVIHEPCELRLSEHDRLDLRENPSGYTELGPLETTVVNTGENGVFTRGEFSAITALGQMEFVTPEEIAVTVVREIRGATSGRDVISALDAAVMEPSYRAGMIRTIATQDLQALERRKGDHSVALGQLGPPELSKLLFEAHLIKETFGDRRDALLREDGDPNRPIDPEVAAARLAEVCRRHPVRRIATSVGIPILLPDGRTLLRGPRINVPEVSGLSHGVTLRGDDQVERWANKGWVDLRAQNVARWQRRFQRMIAARERVAAGGSAAFTYETYLAQEIDIGEVVAWIFNNELGGSRIF